MKIIDRRFRKLEGEFGPAEPQSGVPLVVRDMAQELALDSETCIEIHRERAFLLSGPLCVVDLGKIPDGLNAKETERFLRESGAGICSR